MGAYETKHALYKEYCCELDLFRPIPLAPTDNVIDSWCDDYISGSDCTWRNIFDDDTQEMVGFLIIGKMGDEKHPESDYSIAQAYVKPEYRKRGLMTRAVNEYITKHTGIYSLLVLRNNKKAASFWKNTFENAGYHPYVLSDRYVNNNGEDLILLGFAK